ncbi:MAG: hypothetical protein QOD90_2033 [Mycobacterium sp.]|jgi:hypothetical protein|nr:hypothetical protein [Pseudonocardiales bacterium]MDT5336528.1 hypothetical protein [Mycobacterium sp.]
MPIFQTPEPITATVEVAAGSVHLAATDRDDTVVEVSPRNPNRASDVRAAEQARVDFRHGTLVVSAGRRMLSMGRGGAVRVDIGLPSGSRLHASSASAEVRADGLLGDCRLASASGDLLVDSVSGQIKADTASGQISVQNAGGNVSIATASGDVTIGRLDGDLKFQAASGALGIDELRGDVTVRTASGRVTIAAAVKGAVSIVASSGEVEVGVATGTAAKLDLRSGSGLVSNGLEPADGPADGDETLVVQVRTGSGDIAVRRSVSARL